MRADMCGSQDSVMTQGWHLNHGRGKWLEHCQKMEAYYQFCLSEAILKIKCVIFNVCDVMHGPWLDGWSRHCLAVGGKWLFKLLYWDPEFSESSARGHLCWCWPVHTPPFLGNLSVVWKGRGLINWNHISHFVEMVTCAEGKSVTPKQSKYQK